MTTILQDLRYAVRMLLKNPGFTVVAVLTLALGIGANTAIFSVVNGLLLHPYGIAHPERLLAVRVRYEKLNLKNIAISAPDFTFVRDNKQTFAASAIQTESDFNYATGSWPLRLRGARVSSQWFDVFETKPLLGRVFTPEEDQPMPTVKSCSPITHGNRFSEARPELSIAPCSSTSNRTKLSE